MKDYENKITNIGIGCFWIAIVTELIVVMIDKSAYTNPYESWIFRITFMLFAIKAVTTKYTRKDILIITVCGLIAIISYLVNTKDEVVRAAVFITACKDIDLKKMLKVALIITGIGTIVLFVLSTTGIYGALSVTADFGRGTNSDPIVETRYCFGMGHPNAFQTMLLMMTSIALYLWTNRMKMFHFVLLELVNVISFIFTDSKTSIIVATVLIFGVALMKYIKPLKNGKIAYIMAVVLFIAMVVFTAYGAYVGVNNSFMWRLDGVLNGRFKYAHLIENAHMENWKLFGLPENEEYFDQGFIRLFYWYGIIPGLLYVFSNLYLIWQSYKEKDYSLAVVVVAYAVLSITEAHLISVYLLRNYIFIWLGYYWYRAFSDEKLFNGYIWQIKGFLKGNDK